MALIVFAATSIYAQTNKVVVIPFNSKSKVTEIGGYNSSSELTEGNTFIMSGTNVSLPKNGKCVVTAAGGATGVDGGDSLDGPYVRIAQQVSGGSPFHDGTYGSYLKNVGSSRATSVSATYAWNVTAGTEYNFGCAFLNRPLNWIDNRAYCLITWICTEN